MLRNAYQQSFSILNKVVKPMQRRSFITVVNQAEIAYREFIGMNRVRLEPGLRINIPILHSTKRVDMRESTISIPSLTAFTKDNVPVIISGTLFYKIEDAEKAIFAVKDYKNSIANVGESAFRSVIGNFEYDFISSNRNILNDKMIEIIGKSIVENWGVMCTRFELLDFRPQNDNVGKQLEKQMEAERNRRENELNTIARIKTAEGEKIASILESEGKLQAAKNYAEGEKIASILESEGKLQAAKNEADGIQYKIEALKNYIPNEYATLFLLNSERIKVYEKLAASENKTFVVPTEIFNMFNNIKIQ